MCGVVGWWICGRRGWKPRWRKTGSKLCELGVDSSEILLNGLLVLKDLKKSCFNG
ncbi:hypothetical protein A2U01_0103157, partial [Trifolium medium]|nr:hypothetical protein [Trifolium medium]